MKRYFLIVFNLFFSTGIFYAQHVQWASKVIAVSSEFQKIEYSAQQVLGVPNALYNTNLNYMAWVPKKERSNLGEYIHVAFENPMRIQQIAVAESFCPGAIYRIYAIDTNGKKHKIYEKKPSRFMRESRMFRTKFSKTSYKVAEIKIELKTRDVEGSNQIDAIAISDQRASIKAIPNTVNILSELPLPENLGVSINSMFPDRLPIISPDGNTLFFARKFHPNNTGEERKDDIWVSKRRKDGLWSNAKNIGQPLNNKEHNFVVATNASGNTIYIRTGSKKGGVAVSKLTKSGWSKPKPINIPDFQNKSEFIGYHVNVDGNVLLMAVERGDGFGERDIYVSLKKGGRWAKPKNIGSKINTVNTENNIFLAADNRTLYFSSNGHYGYGGYDIFMTKRLDDSWTNWSEPKNLGKPFNSRKNEFNFSIPASGAYAYFSSGSMKNSDIYRIPLPDELKPEAVTFVSAEIIDAETGKPVVAKLKIQSLNKKDQSLDGEFATIVSKDDNIGLFAEAEGYFAQSEYAGKNIEEEDGDLPKNNRMNPIVSKLKNQLKKINDDIADLKKRKSKIRKTSKVNKNRPNHKNEKPKSLKEKYAASLKKKKQKEQNLPDEKVEEIVQKDDDSENAKEVVAEEVKKELRDEMYADVEKELRTELDEELRGKMRPEIEQEVKKELEKEYRSQNKDKIRKELKKELEAKVKRELKQELRKQVKEDLRREMEYALKKELEKEIRKELEEKLKKEALISTPEPQKEVEPTYAEVDKKILMVPIKVGQIIALNNVFFDANKAILKEVSNIELERVLDFLKKNPNLVVEVGGHTNGLCSHKFAAELSEDRSKVVRQFFLDNGIPENHVRFMGYGKRNPIADNKSLAGRKKNQRVELKILEIL